MADCVLHIGVEKTGSTSIQISMAKNRARLLAQGVLYPEAMGERNQVKTYAYASETPVDELKSQWKLDNPEAIGQFRRAVREQLTREVAAKAPRLVCISNEHCSSRLLKRTEIERLAELLRGLFATVKVVVYVRRQGDALRSAYSTYIKTGGAAAFGPPDAAELERKYDYDAILGRWAAVFGEETMDVRVFDRESLVDGDVVADFLSRIGVEMTGLVAENELNLSLGRTGTEFLRRFNAYVPYTNGAEFNPVRGNIQDIVEQFPGDTPFVGSAEVMNALDESLADSNERVRRRYLPAMKGPLFKPVIREAAAETPAGPSEEDMMKVMASVWEAKQKQVLQLRARVAKLRGGQ